MKQCVESALIAAMVAASFGSLAAQEPPPEQKPAMRRVSYGFRVRGFESDVLGDRTIDAGNSAAKTSVSSTTTTSPRHLSVGPVVEVNLSRRFSVLVEVLFHRPAYEKVTTNYTGLDDTSTEADERTLTSTVTERTKATYWDFPVVVRYRGLKPAGIFSKAFVDGGVAVRSISKVATGTETEFADLSTAYHENPSVPATRNLLGVVAGVGLRFVDDVNFKVTPQVRYTHWFRAGFATDSTQSRRNQIEVGIGLVH